MREVTGVNHEECFEVVDFGDLRVHGIVDHVRPKISECEIVGASLQLLKHFKNLRQRITPHWIFSKI